ncbi:RBR-type E3 ubiquitin transferase [Trifolium repens]|nr:RBR-type E3 ubiquitin transferase [Trifolium repens]
MHQNHTPPMIMTRTRSALLAKETIAMKKRKSLTENQRYEKYNKNKKQATTTRNIKTNKPNKGQSSKSFTCGICFDSVKVSKIFTNTSCNHPFCTVCISKYVNVQRKDKVVKLNWPNPTCSVELKPEHLQSILSKKVIIDWESAIYESEICLKEKIYCPYKNCSLLLVNDEAEVVTSCQCPSCHRLFCAQCKVPWHADMSCREFLDLKNGRDEKNLEKKFLALAKKKKWQKCPKCCMHVQRNGGCEHISCRCGCNFCYKCGKDWSRGHTCNVTSPIL